MRLRLAPFEQLALREALGLASSALTIAERHGEPVLVTSLVSGGGSVLGALQRRERFAGKPLARWTTGPRAIVASLALHHVFALPSLTTLAADATPQNMLNRYIRGFLRGYSKLGAPAQYFGRECFCMARRPCGLIGYDLTQSGALVLEVFAGVDAAALDASGESAQRPVALFEVAGTSDPQRIVSKIHQGFAEKWSLEVVPQVLEPDAPPSLRDTPGAYVSRRVPIGSLEAIAMVRHDSATVRLAGDILCSRAAVQALESRAGAALLAGRAADETVLSPLVEGPLDGATGDDVLSVLNDAFHQARASG